MTATPSLWPAPNPTLYGTRHSASSGHYPGFLESAADPRQPAQAVVA